MNKRLMFTVIVVTIVLSGCGWLYKTGSSNNDSGAVEANLVVPSFQFTNQHGEPFGSEQLEGQLWVANMIFTRCPSVCNLMTPNFLLLQNMLEKENLDVKLVSFTVDPDFDTPDLLEKYGKNNGADFERWSFLTGYSNEEIENFARDAFKEVVMDIPDSADIMHSTKFFLIDGQGHVIKWYNGLTPDVDPILNDIKSHLERIEK